MTNHTPTWVDSPELTLYGPAGAEVATGSLLSVYNLLSFSPTKSGSYYLSASSSDATETGSYVLVSWSDATTTTIPGSEIEAADAPDDTSTPYSMGAFDWFVGEIAPAAEEDWLKVDMQAGTTYQFYMVNVDSEAILTSFGIDLNDLGFSGAGDTGWITGDPHIRTIDGVSYDFQAAGEFVALRDTGSDLEVQARFVPPPGDSNSVSVMTAAALRSDGDTVMIDVADANPLRINDQVTPLNDGASLTVGNGDQLSRSGTSYLFTDAGANGTVESGDTQISMSVFGNIMMNMDVTVADDLSGRIEGLLGDADGNGDNDIALADGTPLARPLAHEDLYGQFRDDWRVDSDTESLFTYDSSESLAGFYLPDYPSESADLGQFNQTELDDARQQLLNAGLTEGTVPFDNALLDFLLTGENAFVDAAKALPDAPDATPILQLEEGQGTVTVSVTINGPGGVGGVDFSFLPGDGATAARETQQVGINPGRMDLTLVEGEAGQLRASRVYNPTTDPEITAGDALEALRLGVGLDPSWGAADGFDFIAADMNGDGKVTAGDALEILKVAVGLDTSNQPEWNFVDSNADFSGAGTSNVPDTGVTLPALQADTSLTLQGLLVGNMDDIA